MAAHLWVTEWLSDWLTNWGFIFIHFHVCKVMVEHFWLTDWLTYWLRLLLVFLTDLLSVYINLFSSSYDCVSVQRTDLQTDCLTVYNHSFPCPHRYDCGSLTDFVYSFIFLSKKLWLCISDWVTAWQSVRMSDCLSLISKSILLSIFVFISYFLLFPLSFMNKVYPYIYQRKVACKTLHLLSMYLPSLNQSLLISMHLSACIVYLILNIHTCICVYLTS